VVGIKVPEGQEVRHINPLDPAYQMPGRLEVQPGDMFGEKMCSMSKTNYASRLAERKEKLMSKLNAPSH